MSDTESPPPVQSKARIAAEKRRLKILARASQRMVTVGGTESDCALVLTDLEKAAAEVGIDLGGIDLNANGEVEAEVEDEAEAETVVVSTSAPVIGGSEMSEEGESAKSADDMMLDDVLDDLFDTSIDASSESPQKTTTSVTSPSPTPTSETKKPMSNLQKYRAKRFAAKAAAAAVDDSVDASDMPTTDDIVTSTSTTSTTTATAASPQSSPKSTPSTPSSSSAVAVSASPLTSPSPKTKFYGIAEANRRRKAAEKAAASDSASGDSSSSAIKARRSFNKKFIFELIVTLVLLTTGYYVGVNSVVTSYKSESSILVHIDPTALYALDVDVDGDERASSDEIRSDDFKVKIGGVDASTYIDDSEVVDAQSTNLFLSIILSPVTLAVKIVKMPYNQFMPKTLPVFFIVAITIRILFIILLGTTGILPTPVNITGNSLLEMAKNAVLAFLPQINVLFKVYGVYQVLQNDMFLVIGGFLVALATYDVEGGRGHMGFLGASLSEGESGGVGEL